MPKAHDEGYRPHGAGVGAFGPHADALLSLIADCVISTDDGGAIILFNRAAGEMFGYAREDVLGRPVEMLLPERYRDAHLAHVAALAKSAMGTRRLMGHRREIVALTSTGREFPAEAALSVHMFEGRRVLTVVIRDISERTKAEVERRLLTSELSHRFKNLMAVVASVVSLTARGATSVEGFRDSLQGRLHALAKTQDALIQGAWGGADLRGLLEAELAPYGSHVDGNVVLSGPVIAVPASGAQSLALALHELATNAAKYGALSRAGGALHVTWKLDGEAAHKAVVIDWVESGGPRVTPPQRRGFGSDLIAGCLGPSNACIDYDIGGVRARLRVRL